MKAFIGLLMWSLPLVAFTPSCLSGLWRRLGAGLRGGWGSFGLVWDGRWMEEGAVEGRRGKLPGKEVGGKDGKGMEEKEG